MTPRIPIAPALCAGFLALPLHSMPAAFPQATTYCGTAFDAAELSLFESQALAGVYAAPPGGGRITVRVPIFFHIVRDGLGVSPFDTNRLGNFIAEANDTFKGSGIQFDEASYDFVDDSAYYNNITTQAQIDALRDEYHVPNTLNVFFVNSLFVNQGTQVFQLRGISSFTMSGSQGIVIDQNFVTANYAPNPNQDPEEPLNPLSNRSVWTHELGHYFNLLHTWGNNALPGQPTPPAEFANGTNCAVAGDLVCDTPAEPLLVGLVTNCLYLPPPPPPPAPLDPNGQPYHPDVDNLMNAAPLTCRKNFTQGQLDRAYDTLIRFREELLQGDLAPATTIAPFGAIAQSRFGSAIASSRVGSAMQTEVLLVGAPSSTAQGGYVDVYRNDGKFGWIHSERVTSPSSLYSDEFGAAIAFDGRRAVIGAPGGSRAYVYEVLLGSITTLQLVAELSNDLLSQDSFDRFGDAVAIHGDYCVIGAPHDDLYGAVSAGIIYLFGLDPQSGWILLASGVSGSQDNGQYGSTVAISNEWVAAGCPGYNGGTPLKYASGSVITSTISSSNSLVFEERLEPSFPIQAARFGGSIAMWGDTLLVGEELGGGSGGPGKGAAHFYRRSGSVFALEKSVSAGMSPQSDFGSRVALSQNLAAISATGDYPEKTVFLYNRTASGWLYRSAEKGGTQSQDFGAAIAVHDQHVYMGVPDASGPPPFNHPNAGSVVTQSGLPKAQGVTLTASPSSISIQAGGTQTLTIQSTPEQSGKPYRVLGSLTGYSPGILVGPPNPGNSSAVLRHIQFLLALNGDSYFDLTLQLTNPADPVFTNFVGTFDANGSATATLNYPPGFLPILAGLTLYHTVVLEQDPYFAVLPMPLDMLP